MTRRYLLPVVALTLGLVLLLLAVEKNGVDTNAVKVHHSETKEKTR